VALGGTGEKNAAPGSLRSKLENDGIQTVLVKNFMRDMSLFSDIRAFFELLSLFRKKKPDVIHVSSSKAGGMGALAGRLAGIQTIIFTSHGLTFDEEWRPYWQKILIRLFTWLTILLATKTILISADNFKRVQKMPLTKNKTVLIHNGIASPHFLEREIARKKLKVDTTDNYPWIGTIAELHPNKNLGVVIRTLALLHEQGKPAHFLIIGAGEEQQRLEDITKECGLEKYVHLLGFVESASEYLHAFDIFSLPSKKEGLPYVLIEAGYAALPVVASNIPGNQEIVTTQVSGLLVPAEAEALSDAFQTILSDQATAKTYGDALKKYVESEFSLQHMVEQTEKLYTSSNPSSSRSRSSRLTESS
jgi:glycosyltransferase involved in cell wall biosynthesis